ncbi:hypothetical protein DTO006G1_5110 [Penicillium roqueforti]|uniref:Peptidase C14, caspase catalytic n=1 Tax=Penicillium roqueforti (strain FM164) TaxID=1365484 RepID=W6PSB3_PENRF|nr:uncharacterized protein LCP9604111_3163 [Penicillium roqueforti]CDM26740.1 Peptidase C14, caspase catalytic [Penicillium roqueforti FM164]KAF9250959.1 hypothetical protein LCP9604111_3163 [Penicillium roqueforti]KAI1833508.1 hypothetical protein CBS147337_5547 [Penicillium roqueforti]KAI2673076.1 hypothetical protein CBS147355_7879 [Penicillium roqueforti]KAI2674761.1 hypothetical protein LCP963914a_8683 [Penicillium roqueforti]
MSQLPGLKSPAKQPAAASPSTIPISFPTKPVSTRKLPDLEAALKKVASARSKFHVRKIGILIRWENDETGAENDMVTMESILKPLGVQCNRFVIPNSDKTPAWSLQENLNKLLGQCIRSSLPSLFIFFYVGHGGLHDDALCFTSRHKRILWRSIRGTLESAQSVDSLVILDCCHAAAAARQPNSTTNIHIIAACGVQEIASVRSNTASFTQRLFRAVQKFKNQQNFTTAEWYQQVQVEKPKHAPHAVFETFSGTRAISLAFSDTSRSRLPRPLSGVSQNHVLVKLTLEGQRDAVDDFSKAVRSLPSNMEVEICNAFETDASVFFILQMSWEGWVLWTSVVHLDFVGVTLGPDLLPRKAIPPASASGENLPPEDVSFKEA